MNEKRFEVSTDVLEALETWKASEELKAGVTYSTNEVARFLLELQLHQSRHLVREPKPLKAARTRGPVICESEPIVVTPELHSKIAWAPYPRPGGPLKRIVARHLYVHENRTCTGEVLECGHILIHRAGRNSDNRCCPLCNDVAGAGSVASAS